MERKSFKQRLSNPLNIFSVVIVVFSLYSIIDVFIWSKEQSKKNSVQTTNNTIWTEQQKRAMRDTCVVNSRLAVKYPNIIQANCSCVTEEIIKKYTPEEYKKLGGMTQEQIISKLRDILIHCGKISGRDTLKSN